jgi:hypothetical protein
VPTEARLDRRGLLEHRLRERRPERPALPRARPARQLAPDEQAQHLVGAAGRGEDGGAEPVDVEELVEPVGGGAGPDLLVAIAPQLIDQELLKLGAQVLGHGGLGDRGAAPIHHARDGQRHQAQADLRGDDPPDQLEAPLGGGDLSP